MIRLKSSLPEMLAAEARQPGGKAAQVHVDFQVPERGRLALRVHLGRDVNAGLTLE